MHKPVCLVGVAVYKAVACINLALQVIVYPLYHAVVCRLGVNVVKCNLQLLWSITALSHGLERRDGVCVKPCYLPERVNRLLTLQVEVVLGIVALVAVKVVAIIKTGLCIHLHGVFILSSRGLAFQHTFVGCGTLDVLQSGLALLWGD